MTLASSRGGDNIGAVNATFWNELCGTALAKSLGVADASPQSLRRFDNWYFAFYPYLLRYVMSNNWVGRRVLEVGLGYGSIGQRVAEEGAVYVGLDIAEGPVAMMRHRLSQSQLAGEARVGDVLNCPFADASFDAVITIGCLHHTGNLARSLEQVRRVLVPGGEAVVMVYSAYSYRRWIRWPIATARYWLWDKIKCGRKPIVSESERAAYDIDSDKCAAPETDFVSIAELRRLTSSWSSVSVHRENIGAEMLLGQLNRNILLRTLGQCVGLDLYAILRK